MVEYHERQFIGYGKNKPFFTWPGDKRLALNFCIHYEEGGENNILEGDDASESHLCEIPQTSFDRERNLFSESVFEYGARCGIWRLLELFDKTQIPTTIWAVGKALERNPDVAVAMAEAGHEICGHGYRWIDYHKVDTISENAHIQKTISIIKNLTGSRPAGWFTGRPSIETRRLLCENRILYDSDSFSDDLPYWVEVDDKDHLIVPFTIDMSDAKYFLAPGWSNGDDFYLYLKDSFHYLLEEGKRSPKMMSIALHARISGRPGRASAVEKFLHYIKQFDDVWICKRIDIARYWIKTFPYQRQAEDNLLD